MKANVKGKPVGRRVAACIAMAVAIAIACIGLSYCSAAPGIPDEEAPTSASASATPPSEAAGAPSEGSEGAEAANAGPAGTDDPQSWSFASSSGKTTSQNAVSDVSGGGSQPSSATGETPPISAPAASGDESQNQPVWVVDYRDVWVEDSPEWDESIPVYDSVEVSICNICGADITGNTAAHGKQHMLAGEGSGHHSEVREVVVGYDTVHHDATGHWERVESGGRWE